MRAVIENKNGVYLIRIYNEDFLIDVYVIEEIQYEGVIDENV